MPENDDPQNTIENPFPDIADQPPPDAVEPVHQIGDTMTVTLPGGFEMAFCHIPAGEFMMGSPDDDVERFDDEIPLHRVVISQPFWMGKFQVPQRQWQFVAGTLPKIEIDLDPSPSVWVTNDSPVEWVSWNDCQEFLARLNANGDGNEFALPTEAEWEYACRAGTITPFSFGATISTDQVNHNGRIQRGYEVKGLNRGKTIPVGSLNSPNAWGLHDMHGNVWEWCADWFGKDSYRESPANDPRGPASGEFRVARGGSWNSPSRYCRSATRYGPRPDYRDDRVGFRVVVSART